MKNKFLKLIIITFILGAGWINFAYAQTPLPSSNPTQDVITTAPTVSEVKELTKADYDAAQANPQACANFSLAVKNATNQILKANWNEKYVTSTRCFITDTNKPDGYAGIFNRSSLATNFQIRIQTLNPNAGAVNGSVNGDEVVAQQAKAQQEKTKANGVSVVIGWVLDSVLSVIAVVLAQLTALAGVIFSYTIAYVTDVTTLPAIVDVGWSIVRDVSNMFFILILIVIGLAAILRIEKYDYRHLLGELIMMAILVNFSKVIALTLINFVNVIGAMFYSNGMGKDIFKTLLIIADPGGDFTTIVDGGWMAAVTLGIGKIIYMIAGLLVFLALAGMFVIRLVGLYVLVIFSPLAYVLDILPATKHYAHEWWEYFLKYLIWAPVALFMIRLNIAIVQNNFGGIFAVAEGKVQANSDSAFVYFILCAFLAAAFFIAEEAGMVGSKAIVNGVEKGLHMGWEYADMTFAKGATSTNKFRRGLSYLSLGAAQKGWQQRFQKKEHEAYNQAAARRADQFSKVLSSPRALAGKPLEKTEFFQKARRAEWLDEKKTYQTSDEAELLHALDEAIKSKNSGEIGGVMLKLAEDGNINEATGGTTAASLQNYIKTNLVDSGVMRKEDAMQLGMDISKIAEDAGQWNFARAFVGDGHGGIRETTIDEQQTAVQSQMRKPNNQNIYRNTTRLGGGFDITVNENGERVIQEVQDHGIKMIENITDYSGFKSTGNKELKTYYMIGASKDMYEANPKVWINTVDEFLAKNEKQRDEAYRIATTTVNRINDGQVLGKGSDENFKETIARIEDMKKQKLITEEELKKLENIKRILYPST